MSELAQGAEERLINCWPAVTTLFMQGWALRFANGYSARANSASAIVQGAVMTPALLDDMERLFAQEGLTPTARVTPVADAGTADFLFARGYKVKDEAITMMRDLTHDTAMADARVGLAASPNDDWLTGISVRQQASKRNPAHLLDIVSRIKLLAAFATIHDKGEPLGFGVAVVDRGWVEFGSIMIDAEARGRGLGHALVSAMMQWGAQQGARRAFLQVDVENAPALKLYERLGFMPVYRYATMVKS